MAGRSRWAYLAAPRIDAAPLAGRGTSRRRLSCSCGAQLSALQAPRPCSALTSWAGTEAVLRPGPLQLAELKASVSGALSRFACGELSADQLVAFLAQMGVELRGRWGPGPCSECLRGVKLVRGHRGGGLLCRTGRHRLCGPACACSAAPRCPACQPCCVACTVCVACSVAVCQILSRIH